MKELRTAGSQNALFPRQSKLMYQLSERPASTPRSPCAQTGMWTGAEVYESVTEWFTKAMIMRTLTRLGFDSPKE